MHNDFTVSRAIVLVLAVLGLCVLGGTLQASTLSIVDIPVFNPADPITTDSDTNAGLDASNTYTHALDFGIGSGTVSINKVVFTQVWSFTGTDYSLTGPGLSSYGVSSVPFTTNPAPVDGNMYTMLGDLFVPSGVASSQLTLWDLLPNTSYSTRLYYRPDPYEPTRTNLVVCNGDGADRSIVVEENVGAGRTISCMISPPPQPVRA